MEYKEIVRDFATRTRKNLDELRELQAAHPNREIYEVTQLMNSLLGLLVFPQQSYVNTIPKIPLDELKQRGWPIPRMVGDYPQVKDLNQLVRYLRNAIAHFNIKFIAGEDKQISGLELWNVREHELKGGKRKRETTWKAHLSLDDVETITDRFLELLMQNLAAG